MYTSISLKKANPYSIYNYTTRSIIKVFKFMFTYKYRKYKNTVGTL